MHLSPPSFLLQQGYAKPYLLKLIGSRNSPLHQPKWIGPFWTVSQASKYLLTGMGIMRKDLAKWTSRGYVNGEDESRGIWRIKRRKFWMSQSCFFLWFLSQNFLWKLSTFRGYKGTYSRVYEECKKTVSTKQGILATRPRDWNELWVWVMS